MAKVIFCGFGKNDGLYEAKIGEVLLRVADTHGIKIPRDCQEGNCASCVVRIEEISAEKQTTYMEDKELNTLVENGFLTKERAEELQQNTLGHGLRLACQMLIKGDILVKPLR